MRKKTLLTMLVMLLAAATGAKAQWTGSGTEAAPYEISSAADWNTLATNVEGGTTYSGKYFKLTANISVTTMVGVEGKTFNGIFDGDGKTLTVTLTGSADHCAPFAYTYGATIKNLATAGTINTSAQYAGGVVGRNGTANLTLTNVTSSVAITSTHSGDAFHGGLVGYTINATLNGCAFTGQLLGSDSKKCGGLVGWKTDTSNSSISLNDCLFAPTEVTVKTTDSKTLVVNNGTANITNCYYTQTLGTAQGKKVRTITSGENVTVAFAGNGDVYNVSGITGYSTGIMYNNTLYAGKSESVQLDITYTGTAVPEHNSPVYAVTNGTLSGITLTLNSSSDATVTINYSSYAPSEWSGTGTEDDPYLIYTNGQWDLLAERVNGGTSTYSGKYFKLMNDISIKAYVSSSTNNPDMTDHLKLVGNSETNSFQGTFDGNGHKIVLNYEDYHSPNKDIIAPFRFVKNATIKRLAVEGVSLQWSGTGGASLVGASYGNTNILSCQSSVYIQNGQSGACDCGGLVAYVKGGTLNMANCVFNGTFGGIGNNAYGSASNWGGMVAYVESNCTANFFNCLFEPKIYLYSASTAGSEYFARKHDNATVNLINCYRSDKHNVHNRVFPNSSQGIDATSLSDDELNNGLGYAWTITAVYSHSWDPHNVFPIMQSQTFTGLGTAGEPYQIATAEDWDKLALYVAQKDINSTDYFQMTGDISTTTMVGLCNQLTFQGTFDGAGHTLNVAYDVTEMPEEKNLSTAAPFTFVSNATIKDLHLTGSIATVGMRPASVTGLVVENSTIENCKSEVALSSSYNEDIDAGGFVARVNEEKSLTMNGCLFTGSITYSNATGYEGGGMVGWTQSGASATLNNCVFAPSAISITKYVTDNNDKKHRMFVGGKVRGTLTNCYHNDVAATSSMVAEGTRAYSIIPAENITVQLIGIATDYTVSSITTYGTGKGVEFDNVSYAASGDVLDMDLGVSLVGYSGSAYYANGNALTAGYYSGSYALTMPAENVTITADLVAAEWDGDGSEGNPYKIYNKAQLDLLAIRTNSGSGHTDASTGFTDKYFKLMADIAYSGGTKNNYTGIGSSSSHKFNGHFDGDNKTISGIYHDNENYTTATGLFGYLGSTAEVKNIVLSNCVFYYGLPMGSIAGNNEGIITDCHVASDVSVRGIGGGYGYQVSYIIGGIVGQNSGTVSRCSFAGMVRRGNDTFINERYQYGGIAGYNEGTLSDNVVIGATIYQVPGPSTAYTGAGAIVGYYVNQDENSNLVRNYYTDITMVSAVWDTGSNSYPRTENATGVGCGGANITGDITPNDGAVHTAGIPLLDQASNDYIINTYKDVTDKNYTLAGRTLYKDGSWNTLCLPFAMDATQIAASDLAGATIKELNTETSNLNPADGTLTLNFTTAYDPTDAPSGSIVAGKPYIVKWATTGDNISNPTFPGITISSTAPTAVEFDITGSSDKCQFVGQYSPFSIVASGATGSDQGNVNEIVMLGSGSKLGYSQNPRTLKCFRAHFYVPADPVTGQQNARRFVMDFGEGSSQTGILTVTADTPSATGIFTLDGRRLQAEPTERGVYIVNGKKIVVK